MKTEKSIKHIKNTQETENKNGKFEKGALWSVKTEKVESLTGKKLTGPILAMLLDKDSKRNLYFFIFLSSKTGFFPYIKLKKCKCGNISEDQHYKIIGAYDRNHSPRKVFILRKEDIENLMDFCGVCDSLPSPDEIRETPWKTKTFLRF